MKKLTGLRVCITAIILTVILGAGTVFADGGFELIESYPSDGSNNASVENLGVKLTFNNPVDSADNRGINDKCFKIINPEGDELPIKVYYNPDVAEQVLVLYDVTEGGQLVARNSETYKVQISGDFVDNSGNPLGEDIEISFNTINQRRNTRIYMVMMLLMIAGMAAYSMIQASRKAAAENAGPTKEEAFNPYKEAKRTGKPVAEVIAAHEKEVEKERAKQAAKAKEDDYDDYDDYDEDDGPTNYVVKRPRPISEGGSKYITGRKAEAEARKAEAEARAKNNAKNKKKK